ncbi:hypothetical protein O181_049985 [Austropuccinia psidii MF-1]|uniref:Uncharacterized protein n=1 Tax=Austropuccinia psidii MF-1 TaxID=1389203 RepID=A0A9Q3DUJ0_9BASI|nr:hypothetical protein [Austropuccinia psidii MF-1]
MHIQQCPHESTRWRSCAFLTQRRGTEYKKLIQLLYSVHFPSHLQHFLKMSFISPTGLEAETLEGAETAATGSASSCQTDSSSSPTEQNPLNPTQQDSPIPHIPYEKTLWQLIPGLCGTKYELTLPSFVEPSKHNEPPIPGPSQASDYQLPSHEKDLTCDPEPKVAPTQSMEEPFACPATTWSYIIIDNTPIGTPPPVPHFTTPPIPFPRDSSHCLLHPGAKLTSFPQGGSAGIHPPTTNPHDSSRNCSQINQQNLFGALPIAPHDSLYGCDSLK